MCIYHRVGITVGPPPGTYFRQVTCSKRCTLSSTQHPLRRGVPSHQGPGYGLKLSFSYPSSVVWEVTKQLQSIKIMSTGMRVRISLTCRLWSTASSPLLLRKANKSQHRSLMDGNQSFQIDNDCVYSTTIIHEHSSHCT